MQTTLNQIRAHWPCKSGWTKLLQHLGETVADDEPLSIVTVLDSNGLDDALWCLQAVKNSDREIRLYAVWCARQIQHLIADPQSINALDVSERFANGQATVVELRAALDAAQDIAASRATARGPAGFAAAAAAAAASAATARAASAAWLASRHAARAVACSAGEAVLTAQADRLRALCAECNVELAGGRVS